MPYSLDIQGNRFVAELTGGGTLNNTQHEHGLSGDEFQQLVDWRNGSREFEKRAGFRRANSPQAWGTLTPNADAYTMVLYRGSSWGGTQQSEKPYYALDLTANAVYALSETDGTNSVQVDGGNSSIAALSSTAGGYLAHAQVGEDLLVGNSGNNVEMLSGTAHTEITGKTATFAAGDATVTGISTALSAAEQQQIIGSYLINTGDSGATQAVYRIISVTSSTELELDRPFNGSNTGATKAFTIRPWSYYLVGTGQTIFAGSAANAQALGSAWGRAVIGGHYGTAADITTSYNRLRWSGLLNSDEGTAPFTGMYAFDDDGYIDLPKSGGSITHIVEYGDAVVVFQEFLMTILYGTPEFNGAGSLDASTQYHIGLSESTDFGQQVVSTPYGLFFISYNSGSRLYRWDGSGRPQPVKPDQLYSGFANDGPFGLAYVEEKIVMMGSSIFVYDLLNDSVVQFRDADVNPYSSIQRGRGEDNLQFDKLVAIDDQYVVDLGAAFLEPITPGNWVTGSDSTDSDSNDVDAVIETGVFGPRNVLLRPERAYLTYSMAGTTGYIELVITTGLNDENSYTSPTTSFVGFGSSSGSRTERLEIDNIIRGIGLKIKLTTKNTAPETRIQSLVIEGAVESIGDSND